jgi:hypothetical protein
MRATLLNPDFAALNPGYGWKDLLALDWAADAADNRSRFGEDDGFRCRSTHPTGCKSAVGTVHFAHPTLASDQLVAVFARRGSSHWLPESR